MRSTEASGHSFLDANKRLVPKAAPRCITNLAFSGALLQHRKGSESSPITKPADDGESSRLGDDIAKILIFLFF